MDDQPARTGRAWRVLRLVLVALCLVTAATAGWTAPRETAYARAQADVLAGRVEAYRWGDHWEEETPGPGFDRPTLVSSGDAGPVFLWQLADGRVRWTDTADRDQADVAWLTDAVRSAGLPGPSADVAPLGRVVDGLSLLLGLAFLVVLVNGPAPALGTRWYWFWVGALPPYGVGLLFWLFRDRPWSRRAARPGGRRDRGFLGLLTALVLTVVVGIVQLVAGGV